MKQTTPIQLVVAVLLAAVAVAGGCRGDRSDNPPRQFLPDLDDQLRYEPQGESRFFAEYTDEEGELYGRTMREPVDGTVPFGAEPFADAVMGVDFSNRADYLREDDAYYRGLNEDGTFVELVPVAVTRELLALGQEQFNIYCIVCHGGSGMGDGMVGERWATPIPSYHQEQYTHGGEKGQDGFIFHTARNGVLNVGGEYPYKMRGYASKISIEETWAIVAYIRTLQASRSGSIDDLPAAEQQRLRNEAGTPVSAAESDTTNTEEVHS
jgi:mono/diheme cytochrome c family protein